MSKITPKNLSYDTTLPPFLARLQAQNCSRDDRHEFSIARPKKARTAEDIADDEPVYFNEESGETLTRSEWEAKEAGKDEDGKDATKDAEDTLKKIEEDKKEEKAATIGAGKKRKVGKIVGGEEEEDATVEKKTKTQDSKKIETAKPKKKAKKIKLSFGDDE